MIQLMTTLAPSAAMRSAMARPIPRDAPVTIATFPARDAIYICFFEIGMLIQPNNAVLLTVVFRTPFRPLYL